MDFPAPDGPKITTNSPLSILRDKLSKALNSWSPLLYILDTFSNSIIVVILNLPALIISFFLYFYKFFIKYYL